MAEPARAPVPEAGGGPSDEVVARGVGKLKAMLSTNEGRALVDKVSLGHQQRARAARGRAARPRRAATARRKPQKATANPKAGIPPRLVPGTAAPTRASVGASRRDPPPLFPLTRRGPACAAPVRRRRRRDTGQH